QDAGNPETQEASSYSVLVIKHQRKVHEQIEKIFDRIENGDLSLRDERLKRIVPAPFGSGSQ
ncbi:MAG TPA: hypothetical protein VLA12_01020, partial [Planctomycetaceae bacterium]|nr:hypothetical protein [Planctomycetaceae bacterium]